MSSKVKAILVTVAVVVLLAVAGVMVVLSFQEDPLRTGSYEACAARMRYDLKQYGQVNEQATECRGLTTDDLAYIEMEILTHG
jgi:ABC-type uncharacterized transport system permease subunit